MNSKWGKMISMGLALTMSISLFVGCSNTEEKASNEQSKPSNQSAEVNNTAEETKEFSYPIEGKKKLTYWVQLNGNVSMQSANLADTPYGKMVAEKTGVEIEYYHPAAGQEKEQFNLLVASGDYPDIVEYDVLSGYVGGPEKAISDNFIIDLTSYMPKYAPNLMKYYDENPDSKKMAKTDTGKLYGFPFIRGDDSLMVYFGPIIRNDWLKDLGMSAPETMDEWYTMLKGFKEEKGATAPLSYQSWMISAGNGNPFMGAYGISKEFYLGEDGTVKFGPIQPEYKDFLIEFSKWYGEGLIDPDIETVDSKQVGAKITGDKTGASIGYQASRLGNWLKAKSDDKNYDLIGTKFPVLNKGDKPMFSQKDFPLPGSSAYITSACKDVETAMRVLDFNYSEEGHLLANFGIEGESYEMKDGYPAYTDAVLNNPEVASGTALAQYMRAVYSGPMIQDARYFEQYAYTYDQQRHANEQWSISDVEKYRMPSVTPTPEESQELATIMNDINTYRDEMYVKYLFGQESLDTFDKYVKNIEKMGIERAIEIYTAALERYNNR